MQNHSHQAMQSLRAAVWLQVSCTGSEKPKIILSLHKPQLAVFSFSRPSQSPLPFPAIQHAQAPWCCSGSFSKRRDHLKCHVGIKSAFKSCLIHLWNPLLSASFVRRKVQALIILKHPAKLGGWGAHSPTQGDEFAIYLWERWPWCDDKTAAAGVFSCNKLISSLVKCFLTKGLTFGTCSRDIAFVQPLPDLKWFLSSGITVKSPNKSLEPKDNR